MDTLSEMYANSPQKENTRLKSFKNQGLDSVVCLNIEHCQFEKYSLIGTEKKTSGNFC